MLDFVKAGAAVSGPGDYAGGDPAASRARATGGGLIAWPNDTW